MKKMFFFAWVALCAVCVFTACSDDDDHQKVPDMEQIIGTYTGTLQTLGTSVPNTQVTLIKMDASKVKLELNNFSFGELPIGDISVECTVIRDTDDWNLNGTSQLTVAALGNVTLPVSVSGDADGKTLDVDILVSDIPGIGTIEVDYEGTK